MPNFENLFRNDYREGLWNQQGNWGNQNEERLQNLNVVLPEEQLNAYNEIIQSGGIYNENEIMRGKGSQDALRRKQYLKVLKGRYAKRLGSRGGGAAETTFANQFMAPQMIQDSTERRNLRMGNAESVFRAIQGRGNVSNQLAQQYMALLEANKDEGGGFMDWANLGVDVASMFYNPNPASAAKTVKDGKELYDSYDS